ncbi:acyl-ACP thioesterase domain-containing protein [Rhodococcus sp. NPDC047139]|uniref:acyl-[acyl-carrier-protein] thioesterase n=1 Tax=Rhodococcus sp. NPDC047139 TaxID=3155141 RepID=UPI0033CAD448
MATPTPTTDQPWTRPLTALPDGANPYSTVRTVRTGDVDTGKRLRLDGVARYLQDIGTDNLIAVGANDSDPLWIVRRTVVDVHRPAEYGRNLRLRRWCDALSTRWANVRVRLDDPDDDPRGPLIETAAFWIDIGPTTGAPTRISDGLFAHMSRYAQDTRLKWKAWLPGRAPDEVDDERVFPLRATDFDPFGHVNNAVYWHGLEEVLALQPGLSAAPCRAVIEHLRPTAAGETITLRTSLREDGMTVWFTVEDHSRAVAWIARNPDALRWTP